MSKGKKDKALRCGRREKKRWPRRGNPAERVLPKKGAMGAEVKKAVQPEMKKRKRKDRVRGESFPRACRKWEEKKGP